MYDYITRKGRSDKTDYLFTCEKYLSNNKPIDLIGAVIREHVTSQCMTGHYRRPIFPKVR